MDSETGNRGARDRRRHRRFADDARVLCVVDEGAGGFHPARLTELSVEGMRIAAKCAFPPGTQLYAGVFLEETHEPLVMLGVVQHCDEGPQGAALGLQFLSLTDEQRHSLERLKEYLLRRHGGTAAAVTVREAPPILRIGEERWW